MLYVSEKQKDVTCRNQRDVFSIKTGEKIGTTRRVFAQFKRGGVPDWALERAERELRMAGKPVDISAARWLCYYDSAEDQAERGWTDDERSLIEETLNRKSGVLTFEPERAVAPWPAYDKLVAQGRRTIDLVAAKIVEKIREDGYDPDMVARYERENLNRDEVLDALAAAGETEAEEDPLIAA